MLIWSTNRRLRCQVATIKSRRAPRKRQGETVRETAVGACTVANLVQSGREGKGRAHSGMPAFKLDAQLSVAKRRVSCARPQNPSSVAFASQLSELQRLAAAGGTSQVATIRLPHTDKWTLMCSSPTSSSCAVFDPFRTGNGSIGCQLGNCTLCVYNVQCTKCT